MTTAKRIAIKGNTFPVREQLKALGASWDPAAKVWTVDPEKAEQARNIVARKATASPLSTPSARHSWIGESLPNSDK